MFLHAYDLCGQSAKRDPRAISKTSNPLDKRVEERYRFTFVVLSIWAKICMSAGSRQSICTTTYSKNYEKRAEGREIIAENDCYDGRNTKSNVGHDYHMSE